jgi:hypothetical protein
VPDIQTCPDAETLREFAAGDTPELLSSEVAAHLQGCDPCARAYDGLADPVVQLLRTPGEPATDPDAAAVVARAARLPEELADATRSFGPRALGKFQLLEELGSGGMGVVYRALDTSLGREVALKVVRAPGHRPMDAGQRARFLREARAAAGLRHENVAPVFEVGEADGTPFLVMPLLPGETLAARLRRGALPAEEVCRLGAQIADGLAAAHAARLVHRDVKPSNVWVEPRAGGWVQLLDFGLVKALADVDAPAAGDAETASLTLAGTPPYMAPEQADGGAVDARTDLFSLGVVLCEMATGRPLFRAAADKPPVLSQVRNFRPPQAAQLLPGVPAALAEAVVALLQHEPSRRTPTATEAARQLREAATEPLVRGRRSRTPLAVAVGLAFAALAAVAAYGVTIRIKRDAAAPGVTLTAPPGATVAVDETGNATVTLPPAAPPKPVPPGAFAESMTYLPFGGAGLKVTDYRVARSKTVAELLAWAAELPPGYVPVTLGVHYAAGVVAPLVHAAAVKVEGAAPPVKLVAGPPPAGWRVVRAVRAADATGGETTVSIVAQDGVTDLDWVTPAGGFDGKAAEMRRAGYRPAVVRPKDGSVASRWVPDGGRPRWTARADLTADEVEAFVTECVHNRLYVTSLVAYHGAAWTNSDGEKRTTRVAAVALENPEIRAWHPAWDTPVGNFDGYV